MRTLNIFAGVISLLSAEHLSLAVCHNCIVNGPASRGAQAAWLKALQAERNATLQKIGYRGGVFDQVKWTQSAFIQPQMHPYDRYFYNPETHAYTPQRFLQDLKYRYGGVDAILLWPTYTNIGVDDRNQFDFFRTMPGGLEGIRNVTAELKAMGVRVLWPYNPWDKGTHRDPLDDEHTLAKLLKQTGGDGFNGDTMDFIPESFWDAAKEASYPIALEPEEAGTDAALNWSTMGWGYWPYPTIPVVDRFKFLTSGKFMTNVCDRWAKTKTDNLQMAWFNGDGYESWENVWGTWNGITPYDGEAIRRVATMLRYLGKEGFVHSADWEPHTTDVWQENIFASKWPLAEKKATVWTIVNRGAVNLTVGLAVRGAGRHYYDCYHGVELTVGEGPPIAPSSPAPPMGYNVFRSSNCYHGHGGVEIDQEPLSGILTPAECAAQCDALPTCSCVVHQIGTGRCWRRELCAPANFAANSAGFDTYLKARGYSEYVERNAYLGHGAEDIDREGVAVLDAKSCMARCDVDKECECVTTTADGRTCWKRKTCKRVGGWALDAKFTVYLNEARVPLPLAPPASGPNVSFPLEAHGYGCVMELEDSADGHLTSFLATMKGLTSRSLFSYSAEWRYLPQTMVKIPRTKIASVTPAGMVLVPKGSFRFASRGVEIEGGDSDGVDVQFPWEDHPQREHDHELELGPFYIDKFPVTNANYSAYLKATGFRPVDTYRWLKSWRGGEEPPPELLDVPVTYVGLEEARAYCAWAGARLPHTYEWQYAAQGTDGRIYPWGNASDQDRYPMEQSGTDYGGPEPVWAHAPAGDSLFGVSDLVGNVWQYTSEFQDDHTRAVLLKGGSSYRPLGSKWYFPQAKMLNTHEKYFLMDARYERGAALGFRCAVDAAAAAGEPENWI